MRGDTTPLTCPSSEKKTKKTRKYILATPVVPVEGDDHKVTVHEVHVDHVTCLKMQGGGVRQQLAWAQIHFVKLRILKFLGWSMKHPSYIPMETATLQISES